MSPSFDLGFSESLDDDGRGLAGSFASSIVLLLVFRFSRGAATFAADIFCECGWTRSATLAEDGER